MIKASLSALICFSCVGDGLHHWGFSVIVAVIKRAVTISS